MPQPDYGPADATRVDGAVSNPDNKELIMNQMPKPTTQWPPTEVQEHGIRPTSWRGRVLRQHHDPVMTFQHPLRLSTREVPADLQRYCELANQAAWEEYEERNTCICTSHALLHFLHGRGYANAKLVRIELAVITEDRDNGGALVGRGRSSRGSRVEPDMWGGHLAVEADGYLLDPTIDLVNHNLRNVIPMAPLVVPLPEWWDENRAAFYLDEDKTMIRYVKVHRQIGWKSTPDARRSSWAPILETMMREAGADPSPALNSDKAAA